MIHPKIKVLRFA